MRKIIQRLAISVTCLSAFLFLAIGFYNQYLPKSYFVDEGDSFSLSTPLISTSHNADRTQTVVSQSGTQKVTLSLLGIFPIKEVSVTSTDQVMLIPSGKPFGVKMLAKGAMIVGFSPITTEKGLCCPGKEAGLREGDTILAVNQKEVSRNEEVAFIIEESGGKTLKFTVDRNGKTVEIQVDPVLSATDQKYKSGVLIRDSAAGIGTITYIDPQTNVFAGLGHAICDVDTGEILSVGSGEVCDVEVYSIQKGKRGTPGELLGTFSSDVSFGNIVKNNQTGIYGQLFSSVNNEKAYPMARKQEVKTGNATILCQLTEDTVQEYDIEIESIDYNPNNEIKNMIIKVTDQRLLDLTGGIVQGMSGTPILQNGKLVGAVTHVFVNDPKNGYAIFAENMYENSKSIETYDLAS